MTEQETLDHILKFADVIGQTPGKPINQKTKNAVKIALRLGLRA